MRTQRLAAGIAAAAVLLSLAGQVLAAAPPGTLDQKHECAAADCNTIANPFVTGGDALYPAWYSQNGSTEGVTVDLAQTFTAGMTGKLTGVEIYANGRDVGGVGGPPTTFTVRVQSTTGADHHPTGTVLATATVPYPASTTAGWVTVTFASQPSVTAGTTYAITLADLAWQTPVDAWLRWELDSSTNGAYTNYAGGEAWAATGSSWVTLFQVISDGGSGGSADLAFRTFVQAAAASPTPTARPTARPTGTLPATSTAAGSGTGSEPGDPLVLAVFGLSLAGLLLGMRLPRRTARRR